MLLFLYISFFSDINECADNTALCNSGKCVNLLGTYKCNCPSGFKGKNCEIGRRLRILLHRECS